MGRAPCCDKASVKRGPWSPEEDAALKAYMERNAGTVANWIALPPKAGLRRCGKSCRLRWLNYLRPDIKHGFFTQEEDDVIFSLYNTIGSRWSVIASQLPGRTDNDVKNYWNTKLKKKQQQQQHKVLITDHHLGGGGGSSSTAAGATPQQNQTAAAAAAGTFSNLPLLPPAVKTEAADFSPPYNNINHFPLMQSATTSSSSANTTTTTMSTAAGLAVSPPTEEYYGSATHHVDYNWSTAANNYNYNIANSSADLFFSDFGSYTDLLATAGLINGEVSQAAAAAGLYHNLTY